MSYMNSAIQFWQSHQIVIIAVGAYLLSAVFNLLTRFKTPEEWVVFGEKNPRLQNVIRMIRAAGIDPVKLIVALGNVISKKAADTKKDRPGGIEEIAETKQEKK